MKILIMLRIVSEKAKSVSWPVIRRVMLTTRTSGSGPRQWSRAEVTRPRPRHSSVKVKDSICQGHVEKNKAKNLYAQ